MFRTISDFATTWTSESDATLKIFGALDERSLQQAIAPDRRTIGRLAWHVTTTLHEMLGESKLPVAGPKPDDPIPSLAAIVRAYRDTSAAVLEAVKQHWTDAMLAEMVPMYGEEWSRGKVLAALVLHQAHHRGQITVLMRQAGLAVPGIYGPAYEEWGAYHMPPQP